MTLSSGTRSAVTRLLAYAAGRPVTGGSRVLAVALREAVEVRAETTVRFFLAIPSKCGIARTSRSLFAALGSNFWLEIDGDLVNEESGVVQEFSLPVEYYEGVTDGESWSEGSRESTAFLSALPAGQYTLRIAGHHEPQQMPLSFEISVHENVPRLQHLIVALVGVSLLFLIIAFAVARAFGELPAVKDDNHNKH